MDAASAQHTVLRTEPVAAQLVAKLAGQITAIDAEIAQLDGHDQRAVRPAPRRPDPAQHARLRPRAGRDVPREHWRGPERVRDRDRLASVAGRAPAPRDSGRISGNHHRPRRFNRRLMRTCYLAALSSLKNSPASRAFYERKRAEGKIHKQALIALARRRINTLWAMLRDRTTYREPAPARTGSSGLTTALRFPMACLRAVPRVERPLPDGEHGLLEPRPAPVGTLMRAAVVTSGAQRRAPLRCQRRWRNSAIRAGRRPGKCSHGTAALPARQGTAGAAGG